nr:hypothetical protein [Tanacetum cinerariifolium]
MDLFTFIHPSDPTKVKIVEREQVKDELLLLQTTIGRTVPLLSVAPDRADSELKTSTDRLFDEGGSCSQAGQGGSAGPRRQRKRKTVAAAGGGSSHPPKKLREDHGTPSGQFVASKSRSVVQRLLAEAVLNVEVREKTVKPFLFVADSSSTGGVDPNTGVFYLTESDFLVSGVRTVIDHDTDLQKVYVPRWSVTNGSRLDDGHIYCEMMSLSTEVMMRAEYNIKEKMRLKSTVKEKYVLLKAKDKEIKNLKAHMVLTEAKAAKAIRLRAEASNFVTVEKSLRDEVNAMNERNTILEKERDALDVKVADLEASAVIKEREMTDLSAQLTSIKSHNDSLVDQEREMTDLNTRLTSVKSHNNSLVDQVHELKVASSGLQEKLSNYENLMEQLEEVQDAQLKVVNDKFDRLYADFVKMALHLEERFYPHLLTTIFGHRWLLIHGIELAITKFLHSTEYLSALGADIGKAIEKGMQDGLSAGIIHGVKGRVLTDIATYNLSLGSKKDASVDTVMNILRLEETLAERLGLNESQPYVDQLMVPIHQLPDQVVIGSSALSLALDVSSSRVQKIKENITNHRSALRDVFVPLAEPLFDDALIGKKGTSNVISATADTTMALPTTLASVSIVSPIAVDDYEVATNDKVHELEFASSRLQEKLSNYENLMKRLEEFHDAQLKVVNDKFNKLYADFVEMAFHLEERFYPHLLTTIFGRRWLLTHGMKLAITKYLHSPEYISSLGAAIGKAIEKGMQDGLSSRITHDAEGRVLTNVAAYNPSAKADYISALQRLQNVNFPLVAELRSNKDAGVDTIMNILRLEETLAERLGLTKSQPHVDQLMVPVKYSSNQVVVGASSLSLAFDVSSTEGTSNVILATADTTMALSTTLASVSIVTLISMDDYEVEGTDDQAVVDGNADPFPNVDDAELNIPL